MKPSSRLRNLHFTGIGGSGMSALAAVLHGSGFAVRGSDRADGTAQAHLRALGIPVLAGHSADYLAADCDAVVFTAAVDAQNPELEAARARGIPTVRRAALLGMVMDRRHGLAIAGTHGKSTTTGMLIHILQAAGSDPGWAVGAAWKDGEPGHAGRGAFFAVEADEYDRAFLALRPVSAAVTNIDADHLDYYGTLAAIEDAFVAFLNGLPFHGIAVLNADDSGIRRVMDRLTCRTRTYGFAAGDYQARDVAMRPEGATFALWRHGENLGTVELRVFGGHNVSNALAAAALSLEEGVSFAAVATGLAAFPGMRRRLETIGHRRGVTVIDDYAHHPAEVAAALRAARPLATARSGRLVVVFQPHLYSRTRQLASDFANAFLGSDVLFVLPVYAAREAPLAGVEGDLITDEAARLGHAAARFLDKASPASGWALTAPIIAASLRDGDVCLTMGAGDVGGLAPAILEALA
jgi:UDP-N-acetylmuramate--alanine ligase